MVRSSLAVDPMDLDIIFFPLNINDVQWALMVCYPKSLLLCYYDSLLNINVSAFSNIIGFLSAAFKLHGRSVNLTDWMLIAPDRIPCQQDSSSCGVYACMNALYSIRPTAHVHSAKDINNIRFWLVHLLLTSNRNSISRKKTIDVSQPEIQYPQIRMQDICRKIPGFEQTTTSSVFCEVSTLAEKRNSMKKYKNDEKLHHQ